MYNCKKENTTFLLFLIYVSKLVCESYNVFSYMYHKIKHSSLLLHILKQRLFQNARITLLRPIFSYLVQLDVSLQIDMRRTL